MKHMTGNVHAPIAPTTLAATGLNPVLCRDIALKTMFRRSLSLVSELAEAICVLPPVAADLIEMARTDNLLGDAGNE